MKNFRKASIFAATILFAAVAVTFTSCEKEDAKEETKTYSKLLEIYDETGENSITLQVSSNDQSITEMYSEESFELRLKPQESTTTIQGELEDEGDERFSSEDGISIMIDVLDEHLSPEITEYTIIRKPSNAFSELRAKTTEFYSSTYDRVDVTRSAWYYTVWINTYYCNGSCSSTNVSDYEPISLNIELKNKTTKGDERCDSNRIGVGVKCSYHNSQYSITFSNPC